MPANSENFINITIIRFCRDFTTMHSYYTQHEYCRLLADGKGIFYMECHYSFTMFWTEDLDPVTLGRTAEHVYTTFFYSPSCHTLCQQSDETLFGCFVIALNAAFDQQLSLADEGYESGSDTIDLPTPLRKTPCIQHVSSMEHTSFNPIPTTPCSTPQTPPRPVCRCLSFSSANSYTLDNTQECSESSADEEEDFQMVSLDNEHWTSEETPERTLCIHEHGLPHGLCPYPSP